jgi:ATP synthase regulation protein NCA2
MALSLARDKLNYSPAQLDDLSNRLRFGDLTPILQIYEEDIKSPVRSAVSGTLLRSAFIQIQKAKVRPFTPRLQLMLIAFILLGGRRPGARRDR